tara:strand:- start:165 stop:320 length:156 start_codon:yes stop_codon:yes gene_type:complete
MKNSEITTIRLLKTTKNELGEYGKKTETYDDVIKRLLKEVSERSSDKRGQQ